MLITVNTSLIALYNKLFFMQSGPGYIKIKSTVIFGMLSAVYPQALPLTFIKQYG